MLGVGLVIVGIILMTVSLAFMGGWVSGRYERANPSGEDEANNNNGSSIMRKLVDWVFMDLNFLGLVIAPLLSGAILIAFGLGMLLR